jgi:hypothetical protein
MKIHSLGSAPRSTNLPALNAQGIHWKDTIREKSGEKGVNGWPLSRLSTLREFVDSPNRWFLGSWLSAAVKLREIVKEVLSVTVEWQ